ncbi:hypothetical protein HZF02_32255 (plasmid) [Pseudomonas yamanorum]|nr:hypothetical protein HZF02_32255 [Pseudomonas yamanorum]
MSTLDPTGSMKAQKLAELRADLARTVAERTSDLRVWRQGLIHGRLLELESFGVLSRQECATFAKEVQKAVDSTLPPANDD